MLQEAIQHYHDLVEADVPRAESAWEELVAEMHARHLTFAARPLCTVLRPHFITESQYQLMEGACRVLSAAIYRLQRELPEHLDWMEMLDLTGPERELIAIDPGYDGVSRKCRLDSFLDGDSLQFVEFNAESPAGISYADALSDVFERFPLMQEFGRRFACRRFEVRPRVEETLLRAWAEFGGHGRPNIAIVDYRGLPTATEFEMFREFFESHGFRAAVCDPRELEYRGGRLCWGDFEIDLVYRRVLVNEFLEKIDEVRPLLEAYQNHTVCMVNSFRVKLVHKKMLFGLLTDERLASFFTAEEQAAITRHIPWTRRARQGWTTHGGERIDLCAHVLDNKDNLVLKPNDEYGGKGVFVGWECTPAEWEQALNTALEHSYVAQEKVRVAKSVFPRIREGLEYVTQLVDLDPYIFDGAAHGYLTRLSETALCNVTSGGGQAPTFVISGR